MEQNEIAVFQQAIEACEDPAEIARKVKLAFKRMPGEMARYSSLQMLVYAQTSYDDEFLATKCMNALTEKELAFVDCCGNNLLWYLTYRDD